MTFRSLPTTWVRPRMLLILLLLPIYSYAQLPPPPNGNEPVQVSIKFLVNEILDISTVEETFDIDGYLTLAWTDSSLLHKFPKSQHESLLLYHQGVIDSVLGGVIWHPNVEIMNAVGPREVTKRRIEIRGTELVYVERFQSKLQSDMDFRSFPFDEQTCTVVLESFGFNSDQFIFVPIESSDSQIESITNDAWEFSAMISDTTSFSYQSSIADVSNNSAVFSRFQFSILAERKAGYFIWQFFLPLLILIVATWFIPVLFKYGIAQELIFTMLLTVVMFSFYSSEFLPQLSYNTFLEMTVIVSNGIMLVTLLQVLTRKKDSEPRWYQQIWVIPVFSVLAFLVMSLSFFVGGESPLP